MDVQLQELLETIKKEGVRTAEEKAEAILKDAELKAREIKDKAKHDAHEITKNAKNEADRMIASGKDALKHASRDLILSVEAQLTEVFDTLLLKESEEVLQGEALASAVVQAVQNWEGDPSQIEVQIGKDEYKSLESTFKAKLQKELAKGVEIRPVASVGAGFKIAMKDGSGYYNFTADGIAEILSDLLNPSVAAVVRKAAEEKGTTEHGA